MPQSYCQLYYHIVFSTKYREPWLTPDIAARVHEYLGGIIRDLNGVSLIVNGVIEHVHLLAKLRQDMAINDVLRILKSKSSGWIHRTFSHRRNFAWQGGYGAFTVSPSLLEKTRRYILNQERHHRRITFEDEFIKLLESHGVVYDPQSIWD